MDEMEQELYERLEAGLDDMAPDLLDWILAQDIRPIQSEEELFGETETPKRKRKPPTRKRTWKQWYNLVAGLAAVFVLMFSFHAIHDSNTIEGEIIVDVNPSVSLSVNKQGRVKNVQALNGDGDVIVKEMKKTKGNVQTVLESVFDALSEQNYLQDEKSGVLVSYCYMQESSAVESRIQNAIVKLSDSKQNCTIYSQTFQREDEEEEKAKSAGVSVGKYYFVNRLNEYSSVEEDIPYEKTMEEIVTIIDDKGVQVAGVDVYAAGSVTTAEAPVTMASGEKAASSESAFGADTTTNANGTDNAAAGNSEAVAANNTGTSSEASSETAPSDSKSGENATSNTTSEAESADKSGASDIKNDTSGTKDTVTDTKNDATSENPASSEKTETGTETGGSNSEDEAAEAGPDPKKLRLTGVKAELLDDNSVKVSWDALEQASGYDVYYRSSGSYKYYLVAADVEDNSWVVSGLDTGKSYGFRVVPYVIIDGEKCYGQGSKSPKIDLIKREAPPTEELFGTESEMEIQLERKDENGKD